MKPSKILLLVSLLFIACSFSCKSSKKIEKVDATYYLVRHAEKVKKQKDPGLTKEGKDRAYFIAEKLKDVKLDAVYTTDYFRTRLTAQPTCNKQNIQFEIYDPSDLAVFATEVRNRHSKGNILIVGHSNTTPQLANYLSNSEYFEDLGEWQYDQFHKITYLANGQIQKSRTQFGRKSEKKK